MSLKNLVGAFIEPLWAECFTQYFKLESFEKWNGYFVQCCRARDPLAHGHKEYLSEAECAIVSGYCDLILQAISAADPDKGPTRAPKVVNDILFKYKHK